MLNQSHPPFPKPFLWEIYWITLWYDFHSIHLLFFTLWYDFHSICLLFWLWQHHVVVYSKSSWFHIYCFSLWLCSISFSSSIFCMRVFLNVFSFDLYFSWLKNQYVQLFLSLFSGTGKNERDCKIKATASCLHRKVGKCYWWRGTGRISKRNPLYISVSCAEGGQSKS